MNTSVVTKLFRRHQISLNAFYFCRLISCPLFPYRKNTTENLKFFDVFRENKKRPVAWNGLKPIWFCQPKSIMCATYYFRDLRGSFIKKYYPVCCLLSSTHESSDLPSQRTQTSSGRLQDVWKRSRRLTIKPDGFRTSGRRRPIYDVLKTSYLRRLEDVRFLTSWRRLIYDV